MKDNYAGEESESVSEHFERRRAEFRQIQRTVKLIRVAAVVSLAASIECLALFDWRVGLGAFFMALSVVLVSALK